MRRVRRSLAPQSTEKHRLLHRLRRPARQLSGTPQTRRRTPQRRYPHNPLNPSQRQRRCPLSAALVLPNVWASLAPEFVPGPQPANPQPVSLPPEIAFYRKYTEGLLRRYLRCSMESGKVPSLLGKEMFRAKVSSYRMESFEDIIIFICDVERCLNRLEPDEQQLIARIALQQYTVSETADLVGISPRGVVRKYREAIDRLTRIFLAVEMLHPQNLVKG